MCGNGIRACPFLAGDGDARAAHGDETPAGLIIPVLQRTANQGRHGSTDAGTNTFPPPWLWAVGLPQGGVDQRGSAQGCCRGDENLTWFLSDLTSIPFDAWGGTEVVKLPKPMCISSRSGSNALEIRSENEVQGQHSVEQALAPVYLLRTRSVCLSPLQRSCTGGLQIGWPDREIVFAADPAEAVLTEVVPELVPVHRSAQQAARRYPSSAKTSRDLPFDFVHDCQDGCRQPDNCLRAEAQQQVQSLDSMSLDAMINLAADSLEGAHAQDRANLGG